MLTINRCTGKTRQAGRWSWLWSGTLLSAPLLVRALLVTALLVAGCNRGASTDQAPQEPSPPENGTPPAVSGPSGVSEKTEAKADASPRGSGEEKDPAPTFVKTRVETIKWLDTKSRKIVRTYKVFSDDSTIMDGDYDSYYRGGAHEVHGQYVDGKKQGEWTNWHENGKVMKVETYLNGQLNGKITQYRDDKTLERETEYKANKREGTWNYYDETGKNLLKREVYADGKPNGTWIENYPNGKPKSKTSYLNGELDGTQEEYYDNGKRSIVRNFKNGVLHGKYYEWAKTGSLLKETEFDHGIKVTGSSPAK